MSYTQTNLVRFMVFAACGVVLAACGVDSSAGPPRVEELVYCDNPDLAAPSCDLMGYDIVDDSALRAKLETCAAGGCHNDPVPATTWTIDLSGSVEGALSALTTFADESPYFLVDDLDPDCSQMLSEVTTQPIGLVRMPVAGGFWSRAEIDCFRKYLHDMN